jgi:hypothetical protein
MLLVVEKCALPAFVGFCSHSLPYIFTFSYLTLFILVGTSSFLMSWDFKMSHCYIKDGGWFLSIIFSLLVGEFLSDALISVWLQKATTFPSI